MFIASLILRNMQILQFNAHEVIQSSDNDTLHYFTKLFHFCC